MTNRLATHAAASRQPQHLGRAQPPMIINITNNLTRAGMPARPATGVR